MAGDPTISPQGAQAVDVTGVFCTSCRHVCISPNDVVDFQKGERYVLLHPPTGSDSFPPSPGKLTRKPETQVPPCRCGVLRPTQSVLPQRASSFRHNVRYCLQVWRQFQISVLQRKFQRRPHPHSSRRDLDTRSARDQKLL